MTDQEKLDLYNEILNKHSPDEVLALKFGLAETMGVRKHIEELEQVRARSVDIMEDYISYLKYEKANVERSLASIKMQLEYLERELVQYKVGGE